MKVSILTQFSRGDVQPFAALARALHMAGHEVIVGAPAISASLVQPYSARVIPFDDIGMRMMADPAMRKSLDVNHRGLRGKVLGMQHMRRHRALRTALRTDLTKAVDDRADVVVHHALLPGHAVAERLGVPAVPVFLDPFWVPTKSFTNPEFPFRVPRALNRASFLGTNVRRHMFQGTTDPWRQQSLGLPPRRGHHDPLRRPDGTAALVLQAFSRHALPVELDYPEWVRTTGYWFLPTESNWTPPRELARFLAAGEPPVYVGFGSAVGSDPVRTGRLVVEAIRQVGVRAVIVAGWGGIDVEQPGEDVLYLKEAPFDWLFPRMSVIVHHGGGGTSSAALAAGRPQVVCPFTISGQRFWSWHVHADGVAPPPLPQHRLTADMLAAAIRQAVTDDAMAKKAEQIGRRIRAEDGVSNAVDIIESLA